MRRPENIRPVRVDDVVRIFGFAHPPGLYLVRSLHTAMAVVSPLREDGTPAKFAHGAKYEDLILYRDGVAHAHHLAGNA